MSSCKLCRTEARLCHSHILPEFLYEAVYDGDHKFITATNHPRHRPRPFQKGFREYLLCKQCETRIGTWETYTASLLRTIRGLTPPDSAEVLTLPYDYTKLKLFALSILWRSHVSTNHVFDHVSLGPHAEPIRQRLLDGAPGTLDEYPFMLIRFVQAERSVRVVMPPTKVRYRGLNAYVMRALGFEWLFVVSNSASALPRDYPFVGFTEELAVVLDRMSANQIMAELRTALVSSGVLRQGA